MALYGYLDPVTARLSNLQDRTPGPNDVPLAKMPTDFGPWAYDAVNKLAVPATLADEEKLDRVALPARLTAALLLRASSLYAGLPANRKSQIMAIIDAAAQRVIDALT